MSKKNETRKAIAAAFPHTLPVLTGFLVLGIAYGVLMQQKGYGALWSALFSMVAFCGSMQYVSITLLTAAFDPLSALLMSIMVNARHLFYGVSMLSKYRGMGAARIPLIYTLCDETFSIAASVDPPENVDPRRFYLAISLLDYIYWVVGSTLGGLLGAVITFNTRGLDFALTALFVVLFLDSLKSRESIVSGTIGLLCSVAALLIFGAERMVIIAMALILVALLVGRRWLCR